MNFEYEKQIVGEGPLCLRNYNGKSDINQKGITLIALIVTIIVMLILAGVTVNIGTGSIDNSKMISFVAYMQTIQEKVDFISEYDNYKNYGEELTSGNKQKLQVILNNETESFFTKIDSTHLRFFDSSHIATDLELENINDKIIVDFNTREVISLNGIEYENSMYYTQYYLPGGQALKQQEEISRNLSFGEIETTIDGLNGSFTIRNIGLSNGTLCFGKVDESNVIKWTTITNYTNKGETITTTNITESGVYYFKLIDNVTGKDNIDDEGSYPNVLLRLTNSPKLKDNLTDLRVSYNYSDLSKSENWAYATDATDTENLSYYIWIPRFAYKTEEPTNIEFLRGTSDITTSGGHINSTEWTVPDVFTGGTTRVYRSMDKS